MREEIEARLESLASDTELRAVIITGVGRAFSTGGDIGVMSELIAQDDAAAFDALVRTGARVVSLIEEIPVPVIAAVTGPAAGAGASLALACDLRLASQSASIGLPSPR